MDNCLEKTVCARKFFLLLFAVSYIFLFISALICMNTMEWQTDLAQRFYNIDPEDYSKILLMFIAIWKMLVIQFTLIPAITLWVAERILKKKSL